jgi:hypothetical protein
MFVGIAFVVAITTQDATLTHTSQAFLLIVIGGLWAILSGVIFPTSKFLNDIQLINVCKNNGENILRQN